ncbi:hypothetical protein BIV57_02210 [Mangrovactinospora gilvigrisea]|uniref:Polyketide cyclase n=1 Tax=Mangrovactinospora gilvigrisea TaxID=1428644 RepID=A0A1J7BK55_9ACTN|nr:SRPBCC family protein [Mangrovactinospora gilvigrisea]OIV39063.1 hypothetical protein BIV57_02210 [Mangrovactinospora gilvigrisea]
MAGEHDRKQDGQQGGQRADCEASVEIDAPAATVWRVLTQVEHAPEWTPSMRSVRREDADAPLAVGSSARVKQPRLPAAVWRVTELDEGHAFTWESRAGGVVTVAGHEISAKEPAGPVVVRLTIRQSGPLAGAARLFYGPMIQRYITAEAAGLKARCEADTPR